MSARYESLNRGFILNQYFLIEIPIQSQDYVP